jgi:hypothetical protein
VPPGAHTYRITYSYGSRSGEPATIIATVNDAATLATMDTDRDDFTDLEEFQSLTSPYDATSSPPARIVAISSGYMLLGGKELEFTLASENGIGYVSYDIEPADPVMGTITSVSASGNQVTFKAKAVGGICTLFFTVSDGRTTPGSSAVGMITIAIEPNPLTVTAAGGEVFQDLPLPLKITATVSGGDVTETQNYTYSVERRPDYGSVSGFSNYSFDPNNITGSAECTYTHTPGAPFTSGDWFTLKITDASGTEAVTTVLIALIQTEPPPQVAFQELYPNSGLDPTATPPWLMVPEGGANWVKAFTPAALLAPVNFSIQPAGSPETASPPTTTLSPTTLTVNGGQSGDNSAVDVAMPSDPTISGTLKISVKPHQVRNVVIHKVTQFYANDMSKQNIWPANVPDADELRDYLNGVFGGQTNTWFNVTFNAFTVDYDEVEMDRDLYPQAMRNGKLDLLEAGLTRTAEEDVLASHAVANAINIYYVRDMTGWELDISQGKYVPDNKTKGINRRSMNTIYMCDGAWNTLHDTAHEVGHQLKLEHRKAQECLMHEFSAPHLTGTLLVKEEWDKVNTVP